MDWDYLKSLLKLFFGGILFFSGLVVLLYNFVLGFEVSLAYLALIAMLAGALLVIFVLFPHRSR